MNDRPIQDPDVYREFLNHIDMCGFGDVNPTSHASDAFESIVRYAEEHGFKITVERDND